MTTIVPFPGDLTECTSCGRRALHARRLALCDACGRRVAVAERARLVAGA